MTPRSLPAPDDQKFIQRLRDELFRPVAGGKALGEMTPEEWRASFARLDPWRNESGAPAPDIGAYYSEIELRPGLTAAIGVPRGEGPFPVIVVTHGPGLTAGSAHLSRRLTMEFASQGYLVITPDFRLAPEHPFPAGHDDVRYTLTWINENAAEWHADASRLALWGDSLGAALALGVILALADEAHPPAVRAYVGFDGPYDLAQISAGGAAWYLGGNPGLIDDKRVSPMRNIPEGAELPSILLLTGSASWGLAGTLDMARALQEAHIDFQLHILDGMPHDFMTFPQLEGCREGHRLMFDYLARTV